MPCPHRVPEGDTQGCVPLHRRLPGRHAAVAGGHEAAAKRLAAKQIMLAGHRLADVLNTTLSK